MKNNPIKNTKEGGTVFGSQDRKPDFSRYRDEWESALLAQLSSASVDPNSHIRKRVLRSWILGMFNGASFGVSECVYEDTHFEWVAATPTQWDLIYTTPYGLTCPLARAYEQSDGLWASLVIAGVKDDLQKAMLAAERAIAQLSS